MNISIFGLGYVGTVTAVCLSKYCHTVIGVDLNQYKVDCINQGISPIIEPGVDELLRKVLSERKLSATTNVQDAVMSTEVSLVCVGTPSNPNGSLDLDQVKRVAEQIGEVLRMKDGYHAIVIRSTVLPGTVDRLTSIIQESSSKTPGKDFGVASNPEFLREGTSIEDFENPPYTVVGTSDQRMVDILSEMYRPINAPFYAVEVKEAEILKYACNAFHAVKVTFANEIGAISKKLDVDSHVVMKIFSEDSKLNISPYYLKPGFAFGGSCLPKDVRAVTYEARFLDLTTPLLESLIASNELQIQRVVDWVVQKKKKSVGFLGLSFKSGTDDLRESPIVKLVETLLGKGYSISIYDSNVNLARLVGANRRYIEKEIPHISSLMKSNLQEVLDHAEIILIANKGTGFKDVLNKVKPDQIVLDLVRITDDWKQCNGSYEGIGW